jgi:hypothetical protein
MALVRNGFPPLQSEIYALAPAQRLRAWGAFATGVGVLAS